MSVPLLGTEYFNTPRMDGVLSGKTAELLIQDGQKQAADIELQSTKAEAQLKAPAITDLYSSAYQKIANGDFTGFADMQKARSLAIGNPILMKTIDSADELAGHLANNVFAYSKQALANEFQAKKQEDLQGRIDDRADKRAKDVQQGQNEGTAKALYMQEHGQWARQTEEDQRQYAAQMKVYEKQKAGYDEMVSLGQGNEAQAPAQPEKPAPRKEPKFEDFLPSGQKATETTPNPGGSILPPGASPLPSQGVSSQLDQGDQPLYPSASDNTNAPTGGKVSTIERTYKMPRGIVKVYDDQPAPKGGKFISDRVVNYGGPDVVGDNPNVLPAQAIPTGKAVAALPGLDQLDTSSLDKEKNYRDQYKPEELAPKPADPEGPPAPPFREQVSEKITKGKAPDGLTFGYSPETGTSLKINIHPPGGRLEKADYDPVSGSVKKEIKWSHDEEKAAELLGHFSDKENLSQWIGLQSALGHPVEAAYEKPGDKKSGVIFRTGQEVFSQQVPGKDGAKITHPNLYSEDDLKQWNELRGLVAKGVISMKADVDKGALEKIRADAIQRAASAPGSVNLDSTNQNITRLGGKPITADDIAEAKDKAMAPRRAAEANAMDRRVEQELSLIGIKKPNDDAEHAQKLDDIEAKNQKIAEAKSDVDRELKAIASKKNITADEYERAKKLKEQAISLEQERQALVGSFNSGVLKNLFGR